MVEFSRKYHRKHQRRVRRVKASLLLFYFILLLLIISLIYLNRGSVLKLSTPSVTQSIYDVGPQIDAAPTMQAENPVVKYSFDDKKIVISGNTIKEDNDIFEMTNMKLMIFDDNGALLIEVNGELARVNRFTHNVEIINDLKINYHLGYQLEGRNFYFNYKSGEGYTDDKIKISDDKIITEANKAKVENFGEKIFLTGSVRTITKNN